MFLRAFRNTLVFVPSSFSGVGVDVPIIRIIIFWGLCCGLPTLGNDQMR